MRHFPIDNAMPDRDPHRGKFQCMCCKRALYRRYKESPRRESVCRDCDSICYAHGRIPVECSIGNEPIADLDSGARIKYRAGDKY